MDLYDQEAYKEIEKVIDQHRQMKANLLLVSVPGMGGSHLLKMYAKRHPEVVYISEKGKILGEFQLVDLGFDINPEALSVAEEYFKKADWDQKIVLLVNDPNILKKEVFKESYIPSHIYGREFLKVLSKKDIEILAKYFNEKLNNEEIERIYELSGALPQIAKFLAVNNLEDEGIETVLKSISRVINKMSESDLEKHGLKIGGLVSSVGANKSFDFKINFDLSFEEKGKVSEFKLSPEEKKIIEWMLENEGLVSKEKVADLKWGEGKYDKFSDQAINKAMRRLADKLKVYVIETVPRVGYRIRE